MKQHIHHDAIIAWAKGAEIEFFSDNGKWLKADTPMWWEDMQYRVKPIPFVFVGVCCPGEESTAHAFGVAAPTVFHNGVCVGNAQHHLMRDRVRAVQVADSAVHNVSVQQREIAAIAPPVIASCCLGRNQISFDCRCVEHLAVVVKGVEAHLGSWGYPRVIDRHNLHFHRITSTRPAATGRSPFPAFHPMESSIRGHMAMPIAVCPLGGLSQIPGAA